MRYLKRIDELFDTPELKGMFEVPYMKGEMPLDYYVKNAKMGTSDPLLNNILYTAPFIMPLKYKRSGNLLSLGFDKDFKFNDRDAYVLFVLEIREVSDKKYLVNLTSKIHKNGSVGYNNSFNKSNLTLSELMVFLRTEFLDAFIEICTLTKSEFDWSILKTLDKSKLRSNKYLN